MFDSGVAGLQQDGQYHQQNVQTVRTFVITLVEQNQRFLRIHYCPICFFSKEATQSAEICLEQLKVLIMIIHTISGNLSYQLGGKGILIFSASARSLWPRGLARVHSQFIEACIEQFGTSLGNNQSAQLELFLEARRQLQRKYKRKDNERRVT